MTGTLTLDGQGRTDGVFIFQIGTTLTTGLASHISFINGAQPCHVFWQVGSSATLNSDSVFTGNILAAQSITLSDSVTVDGRLLAGTGNVTLHRRHRQPGRLHHADHSAGHRRRRDPGHRRHPARRHAEHEHAGHPGDIRAAPPDEHARHTGLGTRRTPRRRTSVARPQRRPRPGHGPARRPRPRRRRGPRLTSGRSPAARRWPPLVHGERVASPSPTPRGPPTAVPSPAERPRPTP